MAEEEKYNDLGLDTKTTVDGYRTLSKNGQFNVRKTNVRFAERINFFHALISMSWARLFVLILSIYFVVNIVFATIYVVIGVENLTGVEANSLMGDFLEAFFFSAQTITTLGYGRIAPMGILANTFAAIESLLGLIGFALATGLLYGRFSKPNATIKYSHNAVIAPFNNLNAFMFRVVNPQQNQLIEVEAHITLSLNRKDSDKRDFYFLDIERPKVVFFPYTWTLVHPINDQSPLLGLSQKDLLEKDAEFIIMMKAFDESFSQTVYSRNSYKANEIKWGHKFVYLVERSKTKLSIDVSRLNETETATLN